MRFILTWVSAVMVASSAARAQEFETYYLNNRNPYPLGETDWSNDVQGVAHDDDHWYITNTEVFWKVPVGQDLATFTTTTLGVERREFSDYPDLAGYDHFGDPDVFRYSGTDYLLLPIENHDAALPGAIAVIRCADLSPVTYFALPDPPPSLPAQANDAGWIAVRGDGKLFTSKQHVGPNPSQGHSGLRVYSLNWQMLHESAVADVDFEVEITPHNEQGDILEMRTMQGGQFAPGDKLLYIISGFLDDTNEVADQEGIHVLETAGYTRVQHSTRGYGYFDYYYDPGFGFPCCLNPECCTAEEPEGLVIWDLDDGRAPGITGQLHVLVSDNDIDAGDVDFKHYSRSIRVAGGIPCEYALCCTPQAPPLCPTPFNATCEFGVSECPFQTFEGALDLAWEGAEIRLAPGNYPGVISISKRVRLNSDGGIVRIGG